MGADGRIYFPKTKSHYTSPSAFSIAAKRLLNPGKQADDGWKSVTVRMTNEELVKVKTLVAASSSSSSSSSVGNIEIEVEGEGEQKQLQYIVLEKFKSLCILAESDDDETTGMDDGNGKRREEEEEESENSSQSTMYQMMT